MHVMTHYKRRKAVRLQREEMPGSEKESEGWGATGKFNMVLESVGMMPLSSRPIAVNGSYSA